MSITAIPAQRDAALIKANRVRMGNAALREDINALPRPQGQREVAGLLRHCSPADPVWALTLGRLLTAINHVGPSKATKWCSAHTVRASTDRRVGDTSPRQREALARLLEAGL